METMICPLHGRTHTPSVADGGGCPECEYELSRCSDCVHIENPNGGWCYMFHDRFAGECRKFEHKAAGMCEDMVRRMHERIKNGI